jgi:ribulose-5-phosphate 4-epimerase/fuculose-1-phosphate aldolase
MSVADELVAGCAVLDREGLTTAFGHLSVRAGGDEVLMSSNAGPGLNRAPEDLVSLAAADGRVISGDGGLRAGESPIHLGIYGARADVASVCRFHGPACLAWGARGVPLPAVIGMGMFCGPEVPVHATRSTVTTPEQGAELARTLGDGLAVLLRGFGAVTVGATIAESVVRAWLLEQNARAALDAGPVAPEPFTFEPAPGQIARAWHYLKERSR